MSRLKSNPKSGPAAPDPDVNFRNWPIWL